MYQRFINWIFNPMVSLLHRIYRRYISVLLGDNCRFYPCCSDYAAGALKKHGPLKGGYLSLKRIVRCQPFCEGGFDYIP